MQGRTTHSTGRVGPHPKRCTLSFNAGPESQPEARPLDRIQPRFIFPGAKTEWARTINWWLSRSSFIRNYSERPCPPPPCMQILRNKKKKKNAPCMHARVAWWSQTFGFRTRYSSHAQAIAHGSTDPCIHYFLASMCVYPCTTSTYASIRRATPEPN